MTPTATTRPEGDRLAPTERRKRRRPTAALDLIADRVPRPRRAPVVIMAAAGVGVIATSFGSLPVAALVALSAGWGVLLGAIALWRGRGGRVALTVTSIGIKVLTVALVVWSLSHPHSPVGPHNIGDWIPLGLLNAGSGGFWLRRVVCDQTQEKPTGPSRPRTLSGRS